MNDYYRLLIDKESNLTSALKKMDHERVKLLIVGAQKKFEGLLSIGDLQRAIIKNMDLSTHVSHILRPDIIVASIKESLTEIKEKMVKIRAEFMPVVNDQNEIVKVIFWEDLFAGQKPQPKGSFNLPVVIMAGGLGTRLKPLTNVLPKPLIPIGEKTMLEEIFDRFAAHGCQRFYISVNYKAELIRYYMDQLDLPYQLEFFTEEKPMGTAGSISLLKGRINETFFVTNCDILIEQDYSEILQYHREQQNEITVVAALKHFPIAYGTIETGDNGKLLKLVEKPELTFKINSGMYILEPHLIDQIPDDQFFHITYLIDQVMARGGRVGVFPVSEKSWRDVGGWKEYVEERG